MLSYLKNLKNDCRKIFFFLRLRNRLKIDFRDFEGMLKQEDIGEKRLRKFLFHSPRFSILIPVYNTKITVLRLCLDSVTNQLYKNWELCIVDDASPNPAVRETLLSYALKDQRIKLVFSQKNKGIAATINKAAKLATGEFIGVLDHDDFLDSTALFEYVKKINQHPDADLIYCDEDKINPVGNHCDPWFKSDWNPDLSLSFNYVMHFALYRKSVFEAVGGVIKLYEGSQDYDLLLKATELTENIYHIPKILYHWRMEEGSIASGPEAKPAIFERGLDALNTALRRRGIEGTAEEAPNAWKGVWRVRRTIVGNFFCSVIVLVKNSPGRLSGLLAALRNCFQSGNFEVLILPQNNVDVKKWIPKEFHEASIITAETVTDGYPGNFNLAVSDASGNLLLFLDDTMAPMNNRSCRNLIEQVQRKEVGAAGGKVIYENGLVEHAGTVFGPFGLMGYAHRATPDVPGYAGLKSMIGNYSAVKGLGMMTRREVFEENEGFDELYKKRYWGADYCLRLREKKYLITYTPYAKWMHHIPVSPIDKMIVEPEAGHFRKRWQSIIDNDPYFNPNFSRSLEDFS